MREVGLPEVLTICGMLFMFGLLLTFVFVVLHRKRQDSIQKTLIDKFGSARDLGTFLETPGGQRFVDSLSSRFSNPMESVLGSIHRGIVLCLLGLGCWLVAVWAKLPLMGIPAVLLACLGVAFLLSALVSYRLSKAWGIFDKNVREDAQKPVER